jgi:hemolysin activation/secretion protein
VGLDYKSFSNNVTVIGGGANLVPEVTVHPLSVTYSGTKRFANAEMGVYASVAHNIYPHGPDAGGEKFFGPIGTGLRPEVGRPTYTVWRYGVTYARAYANDAQMRVAFSGQWTRDALIPGEKFGLGGADSIRGMLEREAQNDRGHRGSVEFYSPDLGSKMAWMGAEGAKLRLLAFVDWGQLQENRTELVGCAGNGCGQSALSTGVGMRVAFREGVTFRLDYGHLIDGGGASNRSKDRYHFGMAVTF